MAIDYTETNKLLTRNADTRFLTRLIVEEEAEKGGKEITVDDLLARVERMTASERVPAGLTRLFIIETFKRMMKQTKSGKLIVGRKGRPTRWVWADAFNMAEFKRHLEAARPGGLVPCEPATPAPVAPTAPPAPLIPPVNVEPPAAAGIEHSFVLRKDYIFKFRLPTDLTPAEAERIATMIRALPIE